MVVTKNKYLRATLDCFGRQPQIYSRDPGSDTVNAVIHLVSSSRQTPVASTVDD